MPCVRGLRLGSVYFCGMTAGGRQLSKAVRPIAQREIPAYAGMTELRFLFFLAFREIPAYAGMTESPTCCGPGAIHAAKVNSK